MTRYLIARLAAVVPTVLLLVLFVVLLVRLLPGNAVDALYTDSRLSDEDRKAIERDLGLDKNIAQDYVSYSGNLLLGDLGTSIATRRAVSDIVKDRIGVTLELAGLAILFAVFAGIAIGVISAVTQGSWIDFLLRSISILGLSFPNFALATLWIVLPTVWWGWSPPIIYRSVSDGWWPHLSQFIAPALVLAFAFSATLMRITRTMMLEVMHMDYIRTARAKGLSGMVVVYRHAFRNALIPVISVLGVQIAYLISGAIVVEIAFGLPGLGRTLTDAVTKRDYPVIQGLTVVTGLLVIAVNLGVDLSYSFIDPRTKAGIQ